MAGEDKEREMPEGSDRSFDLQSEVRDLAARRDITDAVHRYMRGADRLDADLQRSAFHPDAFIDCGLMAGGVDEFIQFAQGMVSGFSATQHILGQVRIAVTGEDASGECYFQAWHDSRDEHGKPVDLFVAGRYVDEYACRDGDWRITKRKILTDWVRSEPADHSFYDAAPNLARGSRGGTDFSETRDWP